MWGAIVSLVQGIVTGIVGPVFTYLGKKQDVTVDGFKTATGTDLDAYKAALDHETAMTQLKLQANTWWGPRVLYMLIGSAAALHIVAVMLDSTFRFGWAVPKLPSDYFEFEKMVAESLFVVTLVERPISAVTSWLHRK